MVRLHGCPLYNYYIMSEIKKRGSRQKPGAYNPTTVKGAHEAFVRSVDPEDPNRFKRGNRVRWTEDHLQDYEFAQKEEEIMSGKFDNELD